MQRVLCDPSLNTGVHSTWSTKGRSAGAMGSRAPYHCALKNCVSDAWPFWSSPEGQQWFMACFPAIAAQNAWSKRHVECAQQS
eukprot:1156732-Pelagomonas_calceolata.AAC.6